ncbi:MAG: hypothetical protein Q7U73_04750, partial [Rubrivivax sp.]|nr:hypothetical protein [Rubrivivax sp.]
MIGIIDLPLPNFEAKPKFSPGSLSVRGCRLVAHGALGAAHLWCDTMLAPCPVAANRRSRRLRLGQRPDRAVLNGTFEKLTAIKGYHGSMCHELQPFASSGQTLADIDALVPGLQRVIRSGSLGSYPALYNWASIKAKLSQDCEQVVALHECNDATYKQRFSGLEANCEELIAECHRCTSFLTSDYIRPFVAAVRAAMQTLREESAERLSCDVEPRRRAPEIAA